MRTMRKLLPWFVFARVARTVSAIWSGFYWKLIGPASHY